MIDLNTLGEQCYSNAKQRGCYKDMQSFDSMFEPMFSEIKEAKQAYREGNYSEDEHSVHAEFIDILFCVLSAGTHLGVDFNRLGKHKLEYNRVRTDKYVK